MNFTETEGTNMIDMRILSDHHSVVILDEDDTVIVSLNHDSIVLKKVVFTDRYQAM